MKNSLRSNNFIPCLNIRSPDLNFFYEFLQVTKSTRQHLYGSFSQHSAISFLRFLPSVSDTPRPEKSIKSLQFHAVFSGSKKDARQFSWLMIRVGKCSFPDAAFGDGRRGIPGPYFFLSAKRSRNPPPVVSKYVFENLLFLFSYHRFHFLSWARRRRFMALAREACV